MVTLYKDGAQVISCLARPKPRMQIFDVGRWSLATNGLIPAEEKMRATILVMYICLATGLALWWPMVAIFSFEVGFFLWMCSCCFLWQQEFWKDVSSPSQRVDNKVPGCSLKSMHQDIFQCVKLFLFLLISELNKTHVHYWLLETLVDVSFYLWTEPEQLFTLTCHVISIPSVKPDASLILWFQYEYGEKYQTISIKCFSSGVYFEAKRIIFLFSSVYAPKNGQSANTFSELLSGCDRSMLKP